MEEPPTSKPAAAAAAAPGARPRKSSSKALAGDAGGSSSSRRGADGAAGHHSRAERSAMGHLRGLDALIKPPAAAASGRLLQPTVSSRIKAKGAEGHQMAHKQVPVPPQRPTQQQQQQQQSGRGRSGPAAGLSQAKALPASQQQQQQQGRKAAAGGITGATLLVEGTSLRPTASSSATAAAQADDQPAAGGWGDRPQTASAYQAGQATALLASQAVKPGSSMQAAKLRLGLTVGLQVAEGLLLEYSQHLQGTETTSQGAGSHSSSLLPTSAAGTVTAAGTVHPTQQQPQPATHEQLSGTLRPNPLFSGSASSGEQELYGRSSVNGLYSTLLLSPVLRGAGFGTLSAAAAEGDKYSSSLFSSFTGSTAHSTAGAGGWPVSSDAALGLEAFSNTMSNPVFRGRAVLDWMMRQSSSGGCLASTGGGSFAGGWTAAQAPQQPTAAASAAATSGRPPGSTEAAAAAACGAQYNSLSLTANSSGSLATPPTATQVAAAAAASAAAGSPQTTAQSGGTNSGSSLPSNLSRSLASTGFSTDSEALGQFVEEQVATDNFVITTETAPNTAHFRGKHLKAAAAAAAARAAAARARAAGADAAAVAAAAAQAAAAAAASAALAAPPTICEDEDGYEIDFSEDGQEEPAEFSTATEAAIQAALEQQEQEQQWRHGSGMGSTQRLPGDLIYEMLPGVDDAAIWATLPQQQQQHLLRSGRQTQAAGDASSGSSALASTLSGCGSSGAADVGSTRAFWYGTGGIFAGLAGGTFGFLGTIGSLKSSASGSSLGGTAELGSGQDSGEDGSSLDGDAMLVQEMGKAQLLLRESGLTDMYLARTSCTMLGAQAMVLSAMQAPSSAQPGGSGSQQAPSGQQDRQRPVTAEPAARRPAAAKAADKRSKLKQAISARMQRQVWEPDSSKPALKVVWNPFGTLLCLFYLAATVYYFYVRFTFTMALGRTSWYSVCICACEIVGCTAVIPYCLMLLRRCQYCGTGSGLPADNGHYRLPDSKRFKIRVLIPCYKEPLSTIQATVGAAITAELPPSCNRVVYLCDDGRDPAKEAYIKSLGPDAVYVSGRVRAPGEINGKSGNLNHCLQNVVYAGMLPPAEGSCGIHIEHKGRTVSTEEALCISAAAPPAPAGAAAPAVPGIPAQEMVVVFDADMCAKPNFFRHVLEVMWDDEVPLCLTPQAFSNIHPATDIWNNINLQFFQYVLPGLDALGYTACTGTNFCVRAQALAKVGWFPTYTITEDYALSMELRKAGCTGRYLPLNLAEGEAPDDVGAVLQQRSRWAKGHMQVFFSKHCLLLQWDLPLLQKILYTNGTWAYFCTILSTFVYTMVPMVSLAWGVHPVALNGPFALAATLYFLAGGLVNFSVRKVAHMQGMFPALVSNYLLSFTYFKAIINTWLSLIGLKRKAGFKATDKKGVTASAGQALRAAVAAVTDFSVTVTHSLASTYRTFADSLRTSQPGGSPLSAHGGRGSLESGASGLGSSGRAQGLTLTGRWQAWRGPSAAGVASSSGHQGLQTIAESAAGNALSISSGFVSSLDGSGCVLQAAGASGEDFVQPWSSSSSSGQAVLPTSTAPAAPGPSSVSSSTMSGAPDGQVGSWWHGTSRLRNTTLAASAAPRAPAAASAPLRPSTAQQPRTGAGLPLGEGAEEEQQVEAAAQPPAAASSSRKAAQEGCIDPEHVASASASGCFSCSRLRSNLGSMGWKLDPWVILLSLVVSCAALAAGAVQLAVRARTPDQMNAIQQVLTGGTIDEFAILAMLLAGINAIPPLLFFVYLFSNGKILHAAVWVGQLLNGALFIGAVVALWLLIPPSHDLTAALRLSSGFLQAQRATQPEALPSFSGLLPGDSVLNLKDTLLTPAALESYPWLKDGPTGSAQDLIQGGFYMGGDYVKHSFPLATNMAMLGWSLLRFRDTYQQAGVLSELRGSLLVGAQYLMDCHVAPGQFVAQIGDPADYAVNLASASGSWTAPAGMPPNRTALIVNATQPGSRGAEVLAAASAALAATSAALRADRELFESSARFRTLHDLALSEAASLYLDAQAMLPQPNQAFIELDTLTAAAGGPAAGLVGVEVFGSSSVLDDMAHAAVWLAVATGNQSLLLESNTYLLQHWADEAQWASPSYFWPSHDNMAWPATILLLGQLQQQQADPQMAAAVALMQAHHNALSHMFVGWLAGQNKLADIISLTPSGFPWAANGKPMPTAAAVGMLGMLWSAEDAAAEGLAAAAGLAGVRRLTDPVRERMHCWGLQMAEYVLGSGRSHSFSYLVGYGKSSPRRPQHRLSSCSGGSQSAACGVAAGLMSQAPNPVQLKGALVAGPAQDGTYADDRTVSSQASVGLHHNIPLIGLLGGLLSVGVTPGQCAAGHGLFQLYTVQNLP